MEPNKLPELGDDGRILEGIVTTLNTDRSVNISPMGPIVDEQISQLVLRPFRSSTTYQNLKRTSQGVFHVTDDVELFAQAAVGQPDPLPRLDKATAIDGFIVADACRWYAFEVESLDDRDERTKIVARSVDSGHLRDFFGFNRAKHALIEAAILATRVHLIPADELLADLERLAQPIAKTGGGAELRAWKFLRSHIDCLLTSSPVSRSPVSQCEPQS